MNVQPLFKIKRAILETLSDIPPESVVVDKINKKVFFSEGADLKFICEVLSRNEIRWDPNIAVEVQERTRVLLK